MSDKNNQYNAPAGLEAISDKDTVSSKVSEEAVGGAVDSTSTKPRKRRKGLIALIVVVAVFIVAAGSAGVVYATQHNNPAFCNAVCHYPMDPYVEGYESGDSKLLVAAHATNDIVCLDCHESDMSQQMNEGWKWVTGDFESPMTLRRFGTSDFCLASGCHDGIANYADLATITRNWKGTGYNPHESHLGEIECYNCHSVHGTSKLYCRNCHAKDGLPAPEGW